MPSRRGGVRKNAGRERRSERLGSPGQQRNQPSLSNFFRSEATNTTAHTTPREIEEVAVQFERNVFEDQPQNLPNYDAKPVDLDAAQPHYE